MRSLWFSLSTVGCPWTVDGWWGRVRQTDGAPKTHPGGILHRPQDIGLPYHITQPEKQESSQKFSNLSPPSSFLTTFTPFLKKIAKSLKANASDGGWARKNLKRSLVLICSWDTETCSDRWVSRISHLRCHAQQPTVLDLYFEACPLRKCEICTEQYHHVKLTIYLIKVISIVSTYHKSLRGWIMFRWNWKPGKAVLVRGPY